MFKVLGVLTSATSWMRPASEVFSRRLRELGYASECYSHHREVPANCEVLFILSYFSIIPSDFLSRRVHNLVVHGSALPLGKGWAPLFWQILEGKNSIPISLIEASPEVDSGDIYLVDSIDLAGHELHDEIRAMQAEKSFDLCLRFLREYDTLQPRAQKGPSTSYRRRTPGDSELDIHKTLAEQFNRLRIADNTAFPAFFVMHGVRYDLRIAKHPEIPVDVVFERV